MGNWLINIAQTGNNNKENILIRTFNALLLFANLMLSSDSTINTFVPTIVNEPPSLFMIKFFFIEFSKKQEIKKKLEIKEKEIKEKEEEIEKKLEIKDFKVSILSFSL